MARTIFVLLFIILFYLLVLVLGDTQNLNGTDRDVSRLSCSVDIYPNPFFWLYSVDFSAGVVSVILYFNYRHKLDLCKAHEETKTDSDFHVLDSVKTEDERNYAKEEMNFLKPFVARYFMENAVEHL